jgi:hypothetical protein
MPSPNTRKPLIDSTTTGETYYGRFPPKKQAA